MRHATVSQQRRQPEALFLREARRMRCIAPNRFRLTPCGGRAILPWPDATSEIHQGALLALRETMPEFVRNL
jgi:hypothetical protein